MFKLVGRLWDRDSAGESGSVVDAQLFFLKKADLQFLVFLLKEPTYETLLRRAFEREVTLAVKHESFFLAQHEHIY